MPCISHIHPAAVSFALVSAAACGPSQSPVSTEGATGSTTTSGTSGGSSSSDGVSETSSMPPDAGPTLPEGCADGVPRSGQFCFELVKLFDLQPRGVVAFDLDGDGADEMLVELRKPTVDAPLCAGQSNYETCTHVMRWSGSEFVEIQQLPVSVTLANANEPYFPNLDFDDDGWIDLVSKAETHAGVIFQNRSGEALEPFPWSSSAPAPPQGDWYRGGVLPFKADGEGYADLLVAFDTGLQVYVREQEEWVPKGPMLPSPPCGIMYPAARADLDEDGIEDVLVMGALLACDAWPSFEDEPEFFAVHAYRSNPETGLLDPLPLIHPGTYVDDLWVRDFDGDGHLDVLFKMLFWNDVYGTTWVRGRGDGTFGDAVLLPSVGHLKGVGDFDGDGDVDLLVRWEMEDGQNPIGILQDLIPPDELTHRVSPDDPEGVTSYHPQAVGDFNGDGVTDIVVNVSTKLPDMPRTQETSVWLSRP